MSARYAVGIDLGTTQSVVAYADLAADPPAISLLNVPQLLAASTVGERSALSSFLYLATEAEVDSGSCDLPWNSASAGHTSAGHTSAGPASAGHTSAGHTSAGHASAGHTSAGHTSAGHTSAGHIVGEWARQRSAEAPTRTVVAAKSWLGHRRVDRHQPILPWQAPEGVPTNLTRCWRSGVTSSI